MNYFKIRKIFKTAQQIRLSDKEKVVLRQDFIKQIGFDVPVKSLFLCLLPNSTLSRKVVCSVVVAVCLVVICLTPLSYAAERSLPGDFLYPLKVVFNETVKRSVNKLVGGDTAQFEIEILKERISEANQLIERYKITEERKLEIKESLADQTDRTQEIIERVQSEIVETEIIKEVLPEVPKLIPNDSSINGNQVIDTVENVVPEQVGETIEEITDTGSEIQTPDVLGEVDQIIEEVLVDDIVDEIDLPIVPGLLP